MNDDVTYRDALRTGLKLHWYEIFSVLGQGGYGITYLGRDTNLNKSVAIKEYLPRELAIRDGNNTVQPRNGEQGEFYRIGLKRFIKEAQTLARFKHPNIVQVQSFFESNNTAYMVMEYERGNNLADFVENKRFRVETVLTDILLRVLDGLEQVHKTGFIHRDIKPANIFLRANGSPVLIDFGSARYAAHGEMKTLTSMVSPGFAPIEQYQGSEENEGPWSDIYALGATCYRLVSGRNPVDAVKRSIGITVDGKDPYAALTDGEHSEFSTRFCDAVDVAMRFNWRHRPQSIKEWREMLLKGDAAAQQTGAAPASRPQSPTTAPFASAHAETTGAEGLTTPSDRLLNTTGGAARYSKVTQPESAAHAEHRPGGEQATQDVELTPITDASGASARLSMSAKRSLGLAAGVAGILFASALAWSLLDTAVPPAVSAPGGGQLALLEAENQALERALAEQAAREQAALERAAAEQAARERAAEEQAAKERAAAEQAARERAAAERAAAERVAARERAAAHRKSQQLAASKVAAPGPDVAKSAPGRTDIEVISELINEFERAFESRDMRRLERTANLSQGKRELLQQVFRNYSVIEVSISDLALLGAQGSASAKMTVTKLLDHDGNRVIPGAWKDQQLVTRKRVGEWQKFEW
jgi:serine/threonine protein kinase